MTKRKKIDHSKKVRTEPDSTTDIDLRCVSHNGLISQTILNALSKLPLDVREFVQKQCLFISVGDEFPSALTAIDAPVLGPNTVSEGKPVFDVDEEGKPAWRIEPAARQTFWVITLYDGIPPEYIERVIVCECANAWIKQKGRSDDPEMLAAFWGFDDPTPDHANTDNGAQRSQGH